jgi:LacI family transcriptional regulator
MTSGGAQFSPNDVLYGEWSERWGREAARILLDASPAVEAIFCGSDQIARGVADTLRILGRRVPEDIALIGFDNWEPMALGCEPALSSIDMCLENVGRTAAQHLLEAINDEPAHGVQTVPCKLVLRGSTAADQAGPGQPAV